MKKKLIRCKPQAVHIFNGLSSREKDPYIHFIVAIRSDRRSARAFLSFYESETVGSLLQYVSKKTGLDDENFYGLYLKDIRNIKTHGLYFDGFSNIPYDDLAKNYAWKTIFIDYIPK